MAEELPITCTRVPHDARRDGDSVQTRLVVGISGASGAIYGIRLLEVLKDTEVETHLVISRAGARTIVEETGRSVNEVRGLATVNYQASDIGAAIASGSFKTMGMVVAPCSIKTAAEVAYGTTRLCCSRAADVFSKNVGAWCSCCGRALCIQGISAC